jgi:hypothetical protein
MFDGGGVGSSGHAEAGHDVIVPLLGLLVVRSNQTTSEAGVGLLTGLEEESGIVGYPVSAMLSPDMQALWMNPV